jgi:hypothetical protein
MRSVGFWVAIAILAIGQTATGQSRWAEPDCAYRRSITVAWNSDNPDGREMAMVDCLTSGHANADGGDVRVTTADGREIPSRVLFVGPGDSVRVLFPLAAGVRQYEVYFGNPRAGAAQDIESMPITCGLLTEMRAYPGPVCSDAASIESAWNGAGTVLGRTMAELPFIAGCILGNTPHVILRYGGILMIPADGQYTFACTAGSCGALYLDGQPIIFVPGPVWHPDYTATLQLARGRHDFVFYQIYVDGYETFVVDWKVPESNELKPITRDYFGIVSHGKTGDLESRDGKPVADFSAEYQASAEYGGNVAHRYTFRAAGGDPDAHWDFGDGQTATGATIDHVYLADGVYPIKIRQHGDEETTRLSVHMDWSSQTDPSVDLPFVQAKVIEGYDLRKIPAGELGTAALVELDAQNWRTAEELCVLIAAAKRHSPNGVDSALSALRGLAEKETNWRTAARLWSMVPGDSDLQATATVEYADLLTWSGRDFAAAEQKLAVQMQTHGGESLVRRAYAHALILGGKADEGIKILESTLPASEPNRRAAVSGACALTVENYIEQGDLEAAQAAWDDWDWRDPMGFLEGYSVMLRVELLEKRQMPEAAAKVAEAFATALPDCVYSPELLDRASKMLAAINPAKSQQIRQLLEEKYPEDPLSQK